MSDPYDADAIEFDEGDDLFGGEGFEASKDFLVLLVDTDPTMFNTSQAEGRTYFEMAMELARELLKSKVISASSDEIALVFYSTKASKNSSSFDHVYVFLDLDSPDAKRIRDVSHLTVTTFKKDIGSADSESCDPAAALKFALWTASQMFNSRASKASRKILLFTNNDNPVGSTTRAESYRTQLLARCEELANTGASLSLFPLAVRDGTAFKAQLFWEAVLEKLRDPEDEWEDTDVMSKVANLFQEVKKRMFRKRVLSNMRLAVVPDLEIGVQMYSLVQPVTKQPAVSLRAQDHELLKSETALICNDTGAILRPDTDITKFRYDVKSGDKSRFPTVVFLSNEKKEMKSVMPPGLNLIGFKPVAALKPHHQVGQHSYFLRPSEKELKGSTSLFLALHAAMLTKKVFGLCSYVRNKASEPRLVALLAQPEPVEDGEPPAGLHMIPLPFADDIRCPEEDPAVVGLAPEEGATEEQVQAAEKMIAALAVTDWRSGDIPNPALQRHYEVLEAVALDERIPPIEEFEDLTEPDLEGMERQHEVLQAFKDAVFGADYEEKGAGAKKGQKRGRAAGDEGAAPTTDIKTLAKQGKLESLTVAILKEFLTEHKLKTGGKKADLIERVKEHLGL